MEETYNRLKRVLLWEEKRPSIGEKRPSIGEKKLVEDERVLQ